MKKLLFILLILPALSIAQKKAPKTFDLIVGTYTKGTSTGIYVYRFYEQNGRMAYLSVAEGVKNPAYICVSQDNKFVYSANENDADGSISAFKLDAPNGTLTLINSQPAGGGPAFVSIDKDKKNVFAANYSNGTLTVLPVNKDGSLAPIIQTIKYEGSGPNKARQEAPHIHTGWLSADEKYFYATDLGTDKLNIYRYHASKNPPLTPADVPFVKTEPGAGPRHFDISSNGKFLYLLQELSAKITVYSLNGDKLKPLQTISIAEDNFKGAVGAADIHITPDGHYLYATNRGDANEIVAYSINAESGQLTYIDRYRTNGKTPRNFVIDPTGKFLLVANQDGNNIVVYKINPVDGKLTLAFIQNNISMPVCLKLVPVE